MTKIKGVKGFEKGLICRGKQYTENTVSEESGNLVLCQNGIHFCENPLDVFGYYPPDGKTEYAEVESEGDIDKGEDKICTNKISIKSRISITKLFKLHFDLIIDKIKSSVSESEETVNTSGYEAHANTSGDNAHANTSGYEAHANTSGYNAHANTSGYEAHANTSGYEAIACALGVKSKSKASKGWIVIVDWRQDEEYDWYIKEIYRAKVGKHKVKGTEIKPDVAYWFEEGKLKSEDLRVTFNQLKS